MVEQIGQINKNWNLSVFIDWKLTQMVTKIPNPTDKNKNGTIIFYYFLTILGRFSGTCRARYECLLRIIFFFFAIKGT